MAHYKASFHVSAGESACIYICYNWILACCDAIIGQKGTSFYMIWSKYYIKCEGMEAKDMGKYMCLVLTGKSWRSMKL